MFFGATTFAGDAFAGLGTFGNVVNVTGNQTQDAKQINLNSGTKGAARIGDTADTGDDPPGISGSDGSNKIETGSKTVIIGG